EQHQGSGHHAGPTFRPPWYSRVGQPSSQPAVSREPRRIVHAPRGRCRHESASASPLEATQEAQVRRPWRGRGGEHASRSCERRRWSPSRGRGLPFRVGGPPRSLRFRIARGAGGNAMKTARGVLGPVVLGFLCGAGWATARDAAASLAGGLPGLSEQVQALQTLVGNLQVVVTTLQSANTDLANALAAERAARIAADALLQAALTQETA